MKTAYSKFSRSSLWDVFVRLYPDRSMESFKLFGDKIMTARVRGSKQECAVDLAAEALWRYAPINHYFLANGLGSFLAGAVRDFSEDYIKTLPHCEPWPFLGGPGMSSGGFAIHFCAKERNRSLIVIPDATWPSDLDDTVQYYRLVVCDGHKSVCVNPCDHSEADDPEYTFMVKVVYGLSLYMDAFPDAVVEAGAENVHQIKHYDGARHIVNRNEIVDEEHRHGVSPHWRRGHFRLLTSAKFVRKQGQTVYVRGTFVKGKAFDVLEDAPTVTSNTAS